MKNIMLVIALCAIAAIAAWFRLSALNDKPMHGDEANQAVKAGILYQSWDYAYDPHEHHGPTLYYATLPVYWLTGNDYVTADAWVYRLVPALTGIALVVLLLLVKDGLGPGAAGIAAAITAVSPAMTYYSRYYIQEVPLVLFTFLAIAAGWRYWQKPHWGWAIVCGAALGLMHATKETCVLAYAAMVGGVVFAWVLGRRDLKDEKDLRNDSGGGGHFLRHAALGLGVGLVVSVVLFTSLFTHWRGPLDSVLTYATYLNRAGGEGSAGAHDKPFHYYLSLIAFTKRGPGAWWSEGVVLALAAVGAISVLVRRALATPGLPFQRFLAGYTILLTLAYCLIAYKTPWSMLSFYHGMILLAGIGGAAIVRWMRFRALQAVVAIVIAAAIIQLGQQAYRANFTYAADVRNPYVYAHTSSAFSRLVQRMNDLAAAHPEGKAMPVAVIAGNHDYWPLPWYLRGFPNVGYYGAVPEAIDADVVIVGAPYNQGVGEQLPDTYQSEVHGLRPGVLLQAYIKRALWDAFMESRR